MIFISINFNLFRFITKDVIAQLYDISVTEIAKIQIRNDKKNQNSELEQIDVTSPIIYFK